MRGEAAGEEGRTYRVARELGSDQAATGGENSEGRRRPEDLAKFQLKWVSLRFCLFVWSSLHWFSPWLTSLEVKV